MRTWLSWLILLVMGLWCGASSNAEPEQGMRTPWMQFSAAEAPFSSPIHYRPQMGRLADTIPFFWKGDYHIFYLRAIEKVPWEHLVSTDLIHWKELPTALRSDGAPDGPDGLHMFTGSVTEHQGVFHIFYTGWNPQNKEGREKIMHATSQDLIAWTKHPELGFFADNVHYNNSDFRDPYVFWNDTEQCFWMVLCARDAKTKHPVQGLAKSKDLMKWTQTDPLILEPKLGEGTPECPDVFKVGDLWHLIHSPSAGTTDMRYAEKLPGPFRIAETSNIDTPILYAAKRMFDGKRHILTGWIRDLGGNRDGGGFEWGGDQSVPREVYGGPNGMLYFKPVPEAVAIFTKSVSENPKAVEVRDTPYKVTAPDNYYLETTVQLNAGAALTLAMRYSDEKNSGYRLTIQPAAHKAEISGASFQYARPISVDAGRPIKIQAFVQGSIIECFINEAYPFSCRAYDFRKGDLAFTVTGGKAKIKSLVVRTN